MNCAFIYDLYLGMLRISLGYPFLVSVFLQSLTGQSFNRLQSAIVEKVDFLKKRLASGLNPHDVSDPRMTMSDSLILYQYTLFQYHDYTL